MADKKSDEIRKLLRESDRLSQTINRLAGEQKETLFEEFSRRHLETKQSSSELRDSTKRAFEYQLRTNLIPAFGWIPLSEISNKHWSDWVKACRNGDPDTPSRITRFFNARKTLMEILHAAHEQGLIDRVPKLDNPDEKKKVGRILTDEEFAKIIRNTTYRSFRFFFFVLRRMGCRPREILQWEWSFITWNEPGHTWMEIPARISKTARTRRIAVHPQVSKHLARQFKRGVSSRFVFPSRIHPDRPQLSYHGAWATALKKAKLDEHAVPYDNRRTFITYAMADNKKPVFVAKQLDTSVKQIEDTYTKEHVESMEDVFLHEKK